MKAEVWLWGEASKESAPVVLVHPTDEASATITTMAETANQLVRQGGKLVGLGPNKIVKLECPVTKEWQDIDTTELDEGLLSQIHFGIATNQNLGASTRIGFVMPVFTIQVRQ